MASQRVSVGNPRGIALDSGQLDGHELRAAIVQSCDDAIISYDLRGIITSWNPGAERLLGYSAEEIVGTPIAALIPPEKQAEATDVFNRLRKGQQIEPYETLRRRKDGSLAELSLTVSPIKDSAGNIIGISKIARDITDLKQTRNQLTVLLGEMRHRIRNFGAIIEALGRSALPKDQPATAEFFSSLMGRVRALLSAGDMVIASSQRQVDLAEIAKVAVNPFVEGNSTRLKIDGPRLELPEQLAGGLALAFHELATNALKYGGLKEPDGTLDLTWAITDRAVRIVWKEHVGRALSPPATRGSGTRLIKMAVASVRDSQADLAFELDGLKCTFDFILSP